MRRRPIGPSRHEPRRAARAGFFWRCGHSAYHTLDSGILCFPFTRLHAELAPSQSLWSNTIGVVALMLLIPLFGWVRAVLAAHHTATWLIGTTGSPLSPAYYVIAAAAVSFIVIWRMPETAHRDLG